MKAPEPERWSLQGLLTHFQNVHETMPDYAFAWIVGAGASYQSGIPTGAQLVDWWLKELHLLECRDNRITFEEWTTEENLGITGFRLDQAPSFYPRVYERRFRNFPDQGYAYLESVMSGNKKDWQNGQLISLAKQIEPSPGYSILAKIMERTLHRAVVTTNFDNLVADALHIYTDVFPLVCGHELLAGYVRVAMRRPLICKIHRDLLFAPLNETRGLRRLHESWAAALRSLFAHYTPIVIGYGGNDESLMGLLESFGPDEIKRRFIWCYFEGRDKMSEPSDQIKKLVHQHNGVLVPVPDFDRFMILLGARMSIEPLDHVLEDRARERTLSYQNAILDMQTADYPDMITATQKVYARAGLAWWSMQLHINQIRDSGGKEAGYRLAIQTLPNSAELIGNFAWFLQYERKRYEEAERLYRKALEVNPKDANNIRNFAWFLHYVRNSNDEAEQLYHKALELNPKDANTIGNFAWFLHYVRKNNDEAERLYRKALELQPNNAYIVGTFALFLQNVRKNNDEAEQLYRKGLELGPKIANIVGNFALFLHCVRRNNDEAERMYRKAVELQPNEAINFGRFGTFLQNVRNNYDEAERLYRKALELEPNEATVTSNLAGLILAKGRVDEAKELIEKARALNAETKNQMRAELLLYMAVGRALSAEDPAPVLQELQAALNDGFERQNWSFEFLWDAYKTKLDPTDLARFVAFGEAI
ncbi:MAG: tetratricopeptide repeat protein, partial [Gemmataceae bacterium]|nr:tetratricopeptide repeat protein [Gemmataceae bacterium]